MEEIKVYRCSTVHCGNSTGGFCLRGLIGDKTCDGMEVVTAVIKESAEAADPERYTFNQAIEVFEDEWKPAIYLRIARRSQDEPVMHWVMINDREPVRVLGEDIRLPAKERIQKGQLIIATGAGNRFCIAKRINPTGEVIVSRSPNSAGTIECWRLPTANELENLGLDGCTDRNGNQWLTEELP
jgi:hypothetical protein